jgi:hypothetical protein
VNKRGSEEGLYGLKSRRNGLEWVSSRIISNVSASQRRAPGLIGHGKCMEEFEAKEGRRSGVGKRTRTITPTSVIPHDLIFKERPQSLLNPLQDLGILEMWIIIEIPHTSSYSSASVSLPLKAFDRRGSKRT